MYNMYPSNPMVPFNPYVNQLPVNPVIPNYQPIQPPVSQAQIKQVNGKESVMSAPMAPNSSEIFVDNLEPKVWIVTTDASGYKAVSGFWVVPDSEPNPMAPASKAEPAEQPEEPKEDPIKNLTARLEKLEERMNSYGKSDYRASRQDKSGYANAKPNDWNGKSVEGSDGSASANVGE